MQEKKNNTSTPNSGGNDDGELKMVKLSKSATIPVRSSAGAAGYDLSSSENVVVPAHGKQLVMTDLAMAIPHGLYGRVAPRSGLAVKKFIDVGAGVVDSDYRGNLGVLLYNHGDEDFMVNVGDRIAQIIFEKIAFLKITEVAALEDTKRANGGFGSTGL